MNSVRPELKNRRIPQSEGTRVGSCENVESRLNAYALAAAAAGAGLLAMAHPAAAEIVYTPADTILTNRILRIDLNHDGIDDVALGIFDYTFFKEKLLRARGLTSEEWHFGLRRGNLVSPRRIERRVPHWTSRPVLAGGECRGYGRRLARELYRWPIRQRSQPFPWHSL
jgi:hypothetical protein